ncbi:fimbrial protein [Dyella koreensis]|uniref:Type 1 fimbrial protein n=1 Tax=Dyella koreensis TaxID=311235 RepID=A0ABW8K7N7_9GAMM
MKTAILPSVLAVGLLACAASVQAQSVTFNVTGTITPGVCVFTANDVDLGTYSATTFTGSTTTGWVDVPIRSTRCDPLVTVVHMRVTGTADAADAALFRGVSGIGVELQQKISGTPIVPAGTTVNFTTVPGAASYMLQGRFKQSAPTVAAGTVRSPVTIQFTYN